MSEYREKPYIGLNRKVLEITRHFAGENKPIAAICHGLQVLVAADVLEGKSCTAYPACGPDIMKVAGLYVHIPADEALVDGNLVTAPAPPAHPNWLAEFLKLLRTRIEHPETIGC